MKHLDNYSVLDLPRYTTAGGKSIGEVSGVNYHLRWAQLLVEAILTEASNDMPASYLELQDEYDLENLRLQLSHTIPLSMT